MPQPLTVLAQETDPETTAALRSVLRGHSLIVADSLQTCLQAMIRHRPPVLIADATRDPLHTSRFVHAIRTLPGGEQIAVLLLVDPHDAKSRRLAMRIQPDATVFWPAGLLGLREALTELLSEPAEGPTAPSAIAQPAA